MDDFSNQLHAFIEKKVDTPTYHLIGHSLGNIIVRNAFHRPYPKGLGRIVMIAPPNQPPALAGKLEDNPLYKAITQDSGKKLASKDFYKTLPIPTVEFGIIAGGKGHRITFKEPNDSVVTVEGTKLEGMTDFLLLDHAHTFIMNAKDTAAQCVHFLEQGKFDHPAVSSEQ